MKNYQSRFALNQDVWSIRSGKVQLATIRAIAFSLQEYYQRDPELIVVVRAVLKEGGGGVEGCEYEFFDTEEEASKRLGQLSKFDAEAELARDRIERGIAEVTLIQQLEASPCS